MFRFAYAVYRLEDYVGAHVHTVRGNFQHALKAAQRADRQSDGWNGWAIYRIELATGKERRVWKNGQFYKNGEPIRRRQAA
jgi:hypothetical protein